MLNVQKFGASVWRVNTYHMIMITSFITISLRMLKNSIISLALSPILPIQTPKAMKNPIIPTTYQWQQLKCEKKESTCLYCIAKVMPIPNTFIPLLYCRDFLSMKIGGGLVALERNSAVLLVSSKSGWTSTLFTTVWTCVFKHHTNLFTISRQFPNGRIKQHASYLLEASLNQVLWKEVSDKVKKGIKTGNLIILGSLSQILLEFWITRVDEKHQDNPQYSRNDSGGHIINHGSGTQTTTWLCIQTRKTFVEKNYQINFIYSFIICLRLWAQFAKQCLILFWSNRFLYRFN